MLTWINGDLVDDADAKVSVFDHGLTVGDGVFETVKVTDGVPFALDRHLARLGRSAVGLGLPEPDVDEVRAACAVVVRQDSGPGRHRLRITYTAGLAPLSSHRGESTQTLAVALAPAAPTPQTTAAAVVPWRRNERSPLAGLKTTSYAENVVALARANALGASEALLADTQGRLSEGTGSNVFVVVDGRVLTPSLAAGCLGGITRDLLLEWTDAAEADLDLSVLDRADEIFLTSSLRDVQAVTTVIYDDHGRDPSGDTPPRRRELVAPGPMTALTAKTFAERARLDPEP